MGKKKEKRQKKQDKEEKKKNIGWVGFVVIAGALLLIIPVIIGMLWTSAPVGTRMDAPQVISGFDAIGRLGSSIPERSKGDMWPISDWQQARLDENTWRVTGDDCMWKVTDGEMLCSENGGLVSVCSENGRAKRYSDLPFCKPPSMCE
jgi:hypothetical protein